MPSTANQPESTPPTNRIAIPPTVRRNLGIRFVEAQARYVAQTIRVPGRFELKPSARREYRTMLDGRVELHVMQFDSVHADSLLFTLDSPQWRDLQERLNATESQRRQSEARLETFGPLMASLRQRHAALEQSAAIWSQRVAQLDRSRESGVVTEEEFARAQATLASTQAQTAEVLEKQAELRALEVEVHAKLNAARERFELLLLQAESLLSVPADKLTEIDEAAPSGHPRWRDIRRVEVGAIARGIVESMGLTNGSWASASDLVLTTVQPEKIRFRAIGLQSDLTHFATSTAASIVPPRSSGIPFDDGVDAKVIVGLEAHPDERTVTLVAEPNEIRPWMRPGFSAFLEVVAESAGDKALAIPRSAIVKDGVTHIFFRRDPADPNSAMRIEADMGVDDGRWVVINSGLALGDQVVLDGAYELKLATEQSGATAKGGHFHADGTFHDEH